MGDGISRSLIFSKLASNPGSHFSFPSYAPPLICD